MTDLTGKQIIVTGSNVGIGYETALALGKMGAHVTMVCRSQERGEKARQALIAATGTDNYSLIVGDLSSQKEIKSIAETFLAQNDRLDVLVNNAGATFLGRKESIDGLELTFALNHLGYFLLTHYLLDLIKATPKSRIVNVASGAHYGGSIDFEDLQLKESYSPMKAYSNSKLANVLHTNELARRLAAEGSETTANSLHPGVVKSNIGRRGNGIIGQLFMFFFQMRAIPTEDGAQTSIYLASSPEVEGVSGKYFDESKEKKPSQEALDEAVAAKLWDVSMELCGL